MIHPEPVTVRQESARDAVQPDEYAAMLKRAADERFYRGAHGLPVARFQETAPSDFDDGCSDCLRRRGVTS